MFNNTECEKGPNKSTSLISPTSANISTMFEHDLKPEAPYYSYSMKHFYKFGKGGNLNVGHCIRLLRSLDQCYRLCRQTLRLMTYAQSLSHLGTMQISAKRGPDSRFVVEPNTVSNYCRAKVLSFLKGKNKTNTSILAPLHLTSNRHNSPKYRYSTWDRGEYFRSFFIGSYTTIF